MILTISALKYPFSLFVRASEHHILISFSFEKHDFETWRIPERKQDPVACALFTLGIDSSAK